MSKQLSIVDTSENVDLIAENGKSYEQGWYFLVSSPMARVFKYRPSLKSSNFRRSPKTASRERSENDADEIASNEQTDA